ncbi:MAG TPA: N-acetyl-gamma-glutamyl-phosphate reductase, partial [Oleiagrimonas sp.]|nr:N-acetyl-gamma-glutamyl-phosphate reductase [Oleiagrimonas sp.]
MNDKKTIGIVGARGHTGSELIRMIAKHPALELVFVSSRELDGQRVADHDEAYEGDLHYENLDPQAVAAKRADVVILALPNGKSDPYVAAVDAAKPETLMVDLSADHRFDADWYYGLPELTRDRWRGEKRISNPGCYATAIQLAVKPLKGLLAAPPVCFGVSGYSGAGTTPSDKNDPDKLRDNIMPYALTGHGHEREAAFQLGLPVEFMPHVAPHFRGLTVTCNLYLSRALAREDVV